MNYEQMNIEQLDAELERLKVRKQEIDGRLVDPAISEETTRSLLKTKNELVADIQTIELRLDKIRDQLLK